MATTYDGAGLAVGRPHEDAGMAFAMAATMAVLIVTGFGLNLALGRSTFAVPLVYHLHAATFFSWTALFVIQTRLAAQGNHALHRRLGRLAAMLVILLVAMGGAMTLTSLRRTGGPFFFAQNEFMWGNMVGLLCAVGLVAAAVRNRHRTDWHLRLMLGAMALLTTPALGRIVPMPLFIPWAWWANTAFALAIVLVGMGLDLRRKGRVHPAWLWTFGAIVATHLLGEMLAYSSMGTALTQQVVAGTPGAARPMAAFLP